MQAVTSASELKQREHETWTDVAPGWRKHDAFLIRATAPVADRMLDMLALTPGQCVLDIACGTGEPAIPAAERVSPGGMVVATDFVEEMLAFAREKAARRAVANLEFRRLDGEQLEFPAESFDAVSIRWGLMFMPDPLACLRQAHRVLKSRFRLGVVMTPLTIVLLLLAFALSSGTPIVAAQQQEQHDHPTQSATPARLGKVHFATSCNTAIGPEFDRGVALLHSFWFSAAIQSFDSVLEKDPTCAMAHWGIAMSWWGNPFGGFRSPQALQDGQAAIDKAKATGAKTDRERVYIAAVETLYQDAATVDQRTRTLAYEKAMAQLAAKSGDDAEARIFYALALDQTALPTDKTYANQLKAAEILEREFKRRPDHPGLAHYIIHSYDVPALATRALDAARRYSKIAPDAPHALHMPSHTFTRVGYWQESIESNIASAIAARKDNAAAEELHALDYQVYAYLQTAQDAAAKKSLDEIASIGARIQVNAAGAAAPPPAGFFALAAIPARYALERNAWAEAAALQPRETAFPWADAVTHFARALGAARTGNPAAALKDVERLAALRDALQTAKDAYWSEQVEIQRRVATAWINYAEGRRTEAQTLLREAADMEDATEKSAVTPGPIKPARELLAEMLLESNRPAEALKEFEMTLKKEPNRFRALFGAAQGAERAGDRQKARTYFARLVEICAQSDKPGRAELQVARKAAS